MTLDELRQFCWEFQHDHFKGTAIGEATKMMLAILDKVDEVVDEAGCRGSQRRCNVTRDELLRVAKEGAELGKVYAAAPCGTRRQIDAYERFMDHAIDYYTTICRELVRLLEPEHV